MLKYVIEKEIPGAEKLSAEQVKVISQAYFGVEKLKIIFILIPFIFLLQIQGNAQDSSHADMNGMSKHIMLNETDFQWGDAPVSLPKGAKLTVLQGDPSKDGPFVIRAIFPANYKIPAHWHPTTENITVLKGSLYMCAGEKLDEANATLIKTGGYASAPAKSPHYAFTKEGCIVQIHAMGPFVINYINPADDPSKKN
jgi:quercetin dioxygenase-like cupin family protein